MPQSEASSRFHSQERIHSPLPSLLPKESMSVTPLELKQEGIINLLPLIRQLVVDSAYQMSFIDLFPNFNTQSLNVS